MQTSKITVVWISASKNKNGQHSALAVNQFVDKETGLEFEDKGFVKRSTKPFKLKDVISAPDGHLFEPPASTKDDAWKLVKA